MSRSYHRFTCSGGQRRDSSEYKRLATRKVRLYTKCLEYSLSDGADYRKIQYNWARVWSRSWREEYVSHRVSTEMYMWFIKKWIAADCDRPFEIWEYEQFLKEYFWK